MEESQTIKNGRIYLQSNRTIMLGISLGNPFFYKIDNLKRLFNFAKNNSHQKILLFLADKISEHNFRAVGGKNPEKSVREKANNLRNKCKEAIRSCGIQNESVVYINWSDDVETSVSYINAVEYVTHLYRVNDQFRKDIQELAQHVLVSLKNGREKNMPDKSKNGEIDLEEGVQYPLKELAFFSVVSDIYESCEEFVFVYPRRCPIIEEYFDGKYDNVSRSCLGCYVVE